MSSASRILAGAMSGTSADGVDIALVEVTGRGLEMSARLLHHHARAYDTDLRRRLFATRDAGRAGLAELAELGREISLSYSIAVKDALREANLKASDLAAIAAHGQTLFHDPPNTIQWFDPSLLAAEVGCPVVSDFRRADCAAGGQGAPLVPFADYILFRHPTKHRVLLNIGGIANVTCIPGGAAVEQVIAFDTGPGNCISDHWVRVHQASPDGYDPGGHIASRGEPDAGVVRSVLDDPWFHRSPPRSTDGPAMIRLFEAALARSNPPLLSNVLATACLLTAQAVAESLRRFTPFPPDELWVSGGGARNQTLMTALRHQVGDVPIGLTDQAGVMGEAKEALAFALLGAATLDGMPSNVPSATGAKRAVVLGSITPAP